MFRTLLQLIVFPCGPLYVIFLKGEEVLDFPFQGAALQILSDMSHNTGKLLTDTLARLSQLLKREKRIKRA